MTTLMLDFFKIGQLFVSAENNLQTPLPECAMLDLVYKENETEGDDGVMDLFAYVHFGNAECEIVHSEEPSLTPLRFSMFLRKARLELMHLENAVVRRSSAFGLNAPVKSVTIQREASINKSAEASAVGEAKIGFLDKFFAGGEAKVGREKGKKNSYDAKATGTQLDNLVRFVSGGPNEYMWSFLPELLTQNSDSEPVYSALDGVFMSHQQVLLQFKKDRTKNSTLLFGIRISIKDIGFKFSVIEDKWWSQNFVRNGFGDKSVVAQEMLRDYLRKSISSSKLSGDDVFIVIAAAQKDEF